MADRDFNETARYLASQNTPDHRSNSSSPQARRSADHYRPRSQSPARHSSSNGPDRISFRHSRHLSTSSQPSSSRRARWMDKATSLWTRLYEAVDKLSTIQQILLGVGGLGFFVAVILFLVFSGKIIHGLLPLVKAWREWRAGWLLAWVLIVLVSFPPMIGYTTVLTMCGFVWGIWIGWIIAATATVVGSTLSFLASRLFLKGFVERLIANDKRFEAISLTLEHDGLKLLVMIRLCPLPYSLANGAIAAVPSVSWQQMAIATAIASPKIFIGVFIGSRLNDLAEGTTDVKAKIVSYVGIAMSIAIGVGVGSFMYNKTQQRAKELRAAEERGGSTPSGRRPVGSDEEEGLDGDHFDYADDFSIADDTAARGADGISLHTTDGNGAKVYRDESESDEGDLTLDDASRTGDDSDDGGQTKKTVR